MKYTLLMTLVIASPLDDILIVAVMAWLTKLVKQRTLAPVTAR